MSKPSKESERGYFVQIEFFEFSKSFIPASSKPYDPVCRLQLSRDQAIKIRDLIDNTLAKEPAE